MSRNVAEFDIHGTLYTQGVNQTFNRLWCVRELPPTCPAAVPVLATVTRHFAAVFRTRLVLAKAVFSATIVTPSGTMTFKGMTIRMIPGFDEEIKVGPSNRRDCSRDSLQSNPFDMR